MSVAGAVAADPDHAFGIDDDAVIRLRPFEALARAAPRVHNVALLIELDDGWRRNAAVG